MLKSLSLLAWPPDPSPSPGGLGWGAPSRVSSHGGVAGRWEVREQLRHPSSGPRGSASVAGWTSALTFHSAGDHQTVGSWNP